MKEVNPYYVFVLIQLCYEMKIIDKKLEYDIAWNEGSMYYDNFLNSKYNDANKSEYDCISDYLGNLPEKEYDFTIEAIEINRYNYIAKGRTLLEARENMKKAFTDHPIPYPNHCKEHGDSVIGCDRETAYSTLEIKSITDSNNNNIEL